MNEQHEHFFSCPYCWTRISMLVDPSAGDQTYVEDCERCCNPISIHYQVEEGEVTSFEVEKAY